METLSTRIKRTGKGFEDHGNQFLVDTKQASKSFVGFVQGEAKDWGTYLRNRYRTFESQGRDALKPGTDSRRDKVWAQVDGILCKIKRQQIEAASAEEAHMADKSEEGILVDMEDETNFEEVNESEIEENEE